MIMMKNLIFLSHLLLLMGTTTTAAAAEDNDDAEVYNIAIVPKMRAAEAFYGRTFEGCTNYVKNMNNVNCLYYGSYEPNVEENIRIINELINNDTIHGISISVLDNDKYTPIINRGIDKGKHIITFDSDAPDSNRLAYVGTNNTKMGEELGKLLKQIKPDGGKYGIVTAFGPDNLQKRVNGVRKILDEKSGWEEISISPKDGKEETKASLEKMWEYVREYPGIDAIVSVVGLPMFDPNTTDWMNFIDSNKNVKTIIADTLDVQLDLMQKSYVDALVGQLPYDMGVQSAKALLQVRDAVVNNKGISLDKALPYDEDPITHQLEVLRVPLQLPPFKFDYNYIGNAAILGYILCAMIILGSVGSMIWTCLNRKKRVVTSSQPVFLIMICIGTLLMGSAIIPLSIDDENHSVRGADIACMSSPWLINIGFTIAFSALFSKTWRLNKILLTKNALKKIKVTEKDVILPFIVLLSINIIALICWTVIAPLRFVRTEGNGLDPWNRPISSYGSCMSTSDAAGGSIPYLVVIATANVTALAIANYQAYRARHVRTEFNESSYIAMANASFLQAIMICVPIIFLTRENPQAYFIVVSVTLFILSGAILVFIFVPKMYALAKNKDKKLSSIKISGVSSGTCSSLASQGTSSSVGDPVNNLVQQFQRLNFAEKSAVMKKLGAAHSVTMTSFSMSSSGSEGVGSNFEDNSKVVTIDDADEEKGISKVPEATEASWSGDAFVNDVADGNNTKKIMNIEQATVDTDKKTIPESSGSSEKSEQEE